MYILKPEMAHELKDTENEIYLESPGFLKEAEYIATIGDICTIKIFEQIREPNLAIVDLKTKRNISLDNNQLKTIMKIGIDKIEVENPPGSISNQMWKAIESSFSNENNTRITVKGEEDLATLVVISMAPKGAKVIYGMPDRGMVVVDVNQQSKKRANNFLKRMLV
jgi:GTP-dependent dephospho-CoA kinase